MLKEIIKRSFNLFGVDIIRSNITPLDRFFRILKLINFYPNHIVDVGANRGTWTRKAINYFPTAQYTLLV